MVDVANVPESVTTMQSVPEGEDHMHLLSVPCGARHTAKLLMMMADLNLFLINVKTWNMAAIPRSQICPKVVNILLQLKKKVLSQLMNCRGPHQKLLQNNGTG